MSDPFRIHPRLIQRLFRHGESVIRTLLPLISTTVSPKDPRTRNVLSSPRGKIYAGFPFTSTCTVSFAGRTALIKKKPETDKTHNIKKRSRSARVVVLKRVLKLNAPPDSAGNVNNSLVIYNHSLKTILLENVHTLISTENEYSGGKGISQSTVG